MLITVFKLMRSLLIFPLLFIALDLPVTNWWAGAILALGMLVVVAAKTSRQWQKWSLAFALALVAVFVRAVLPVAHIDEGHHVYAGSEHKAKYVDILPGPVLEHLDHYWQHNYPKAPGFPYVTDGFRWQFPYAGADFAWEPESIWNKTKLSRSVRTIDFDTPLGFQIGNYNDLRYGSYGIKRPPRSQLPTYFRFDIPQSLAQSASLCWKGDVFVPTGMDEFVLTPHAERQCVELKSLPQNANGLTLWATSFGPDRLLAMTLEKAAFDKVIDGVYDFVGVLAGLLIIILLAEQFCLSRGAAYVGSLLMACIVVFHAASLVIVDPSGFVLLEAGNDGLILNGFARYVLYSATAGDWFNVLRSPESVFDWQAGLRYFNAAYFVLFGSTFFGWLVVIALIPLVMFKFIVTLLGKGWARWLMLFFIAIPAFEAFGFLYFYYLKEFVRGFAEAQAYLLFFGAIVLTLKTYQGRNGEKGVDCSYPELFCAGLMFALSVILRANLAIGVGMYLLILGLVLLSRSDVKRATVLSVGFLPMSLVPIHNWYFGTPETFYFLTRSAARTFNRGASPTDYWMAFQGALSGDFMTPALGVVKTQILAEMKPAEPWYYLVLVLCILMVARKATCPRLRVIGMTALALQTLVLFYRVGGRYSYATWTLTLLVALAYIADVIVPMVLSDDRRDAIRNRFAHWGDCLSRKLSNIQSSMRSVVKRG